LYREIIAVCSEIHTKRINTLCGQNAGFLSVKLGGKRNYKFGPAHLIRAYRWTKVPAALALLAAAGTGLQDKH
jgi:hypothetical protein